MNRNRTSLAAQLCKAVNDEEPRTVQILLTKGANPNLVGDKGVAAVHLAVGRETEKCIRCLKLILQHGADPTTRSSEGLTPLHVAALWGCYQNLRLLLKNGGNPNLKDQDGNTAGDLAQQQENHKCALLLQEYRTSSMDTDEEDLPQFQYSVYCNQTDTSGYSASDCSVSSRSLSLMSDPGDAPLSSTRRSSFLDISAIPAVSGRPSWRGGPPFRPSDAHARGGPSHKWYIDADYRPEVPSMLSSTRISVVGSGAPMPILAEGVALADCSVSALPGDKFEDLPPGPARRASRKSVSFKDADEYFPVFGSESSPPRPRPRPRPAARTSPCSPENTLNLSEYSDFLDSERMATVLRRQGIDVTSPDHVYVFSRDDGESTEEDMEKTVMGHLPFVESEEENADGKLSQVAAPQLPACHSGGSSSGSSQYSSCESDHYTSALEASLHPRQMSPSDKERTFSNTAKIAEADSPIPIDSDDVFINTDRFKQHTNNPPSQMTAATLSAMVDHLALSDAMCAARVGVAARRDDQEQGLEGPTEVGVEERAAGPTVGTPAASALDEDPGTPMTPSPFVTGRTRSRLSRCSMRTGSLLSNSSLFEKTLPTPTRTRRQKSENDDGGTPGKDSWTSVFSGSSSGSRAGDPVFPWSPETQPVTLRAGSCVRGSQADTLIISGGTTAQSLADTVILEKKEETSSSDSFESYQREIFLAYRREHGEFLTDDLSRSNEAAIIGNSKDLPDVERERSPGLEDETPWVTEDTSSSLSSSSGSQHPSSSSSSSSYFSPKRSTEDAPSTPGTGCTPRYSMSRLSGLHKPQRLANLSYTPGGRPLLLDLEEPVEYLYTDTEQGLELIETHVPPTANTSLSSGASGEETVLYDWRSMQLGLAGKGKENQQPAQEYQQQQQQQQQEEELPETKGLTDRELRRRLVELGESPGPISSRTRPVYMKRLRRLLLDPNTQTQPQPLDRSKAGPGHSSELCRALRTFELPDCEADELALCQQFDQPDQNRKWREGVIKSSFNYLLLDPRVTANLPYRSRSMTPQECFQTFVSAIFYVGKGKRSRPYSHLYEALEYYRGDKTSKKLCSKVQHILQVWTAGQGVISLHCFQNVIPVEAYTREACMVDAIGLKMLTNQKRGDFYGVVSTWSVTRKRQLGVHLLYRAMQIFLAEGERQLRPADIRAGQ
ncbi:uncharacterized protein FYW47_008681 [Aplochiton taeniatus]